MQILIQIMTVEQFCILKVSLLPETFIIILLLKSQSDDTTATVFQEDSES